MCKVSGSTLNPILYKWLYHVVISWCEYIMYIAFTCYDEMCICSRWYYWSCITYVWQYGSASLLYQGCTHTPQHGQEAIKMGSNIKVWLAQIKRKRKKIYCILYSCTKSKFCTLTLMIHHLIWALPLKYSNVPDGDYSRNEDEWGMKWPLAKCMMNWMYVM